MQIAFTRNEISFLIQYSLYVCVVQDEIISKSLLVEENICIAIKYILFNVLILVGVFGWTNSNNFKIIHPVLCHTIKKERNK
jgi:hypothetical protein